MGRTLQRRSCGREIYPIERAAMTSEARLGRALERCRAWNIRHGNWSQEMEELVKAALGAEIGSYEEEEEHHQGSYEASQQPHRQDRDVQNTRGYHPGESHS